MRDMDVVSRGDFDHATKPASTDEIGLLALAFNDMTKSLKAARELEREAERFQGELNTAQEIQAHLLPAKIPQLPGFDIYQAYAAAKEVGGDYFDFIPIDRENLGVVVADVSGKGIPGSMVMAQTRAVLRMLATGNASASATLAQTNAIIARDIKRGMFVTMLYAVLNVRQKTLTVASAGHNPMVLLRARTGAVELVNPAGIALGFDKGPIFNRTIKEQTIQLYKGDRVVLYTDGVVEAMNEKHEEFTDERFYKWVQANAREMRSRDFVVGLQKELEAHRGRAEQHDDITVVTIRVE
jgi:sigma-B regulation protein RsbU (phosphoserine phosphatase)